MTTRCLWDLCVVFVIGLCCYQSVTTRWLWDPCVVFVVTSQWLQDVCMVCVQSLLLPVDDSKMSRYLWDLRVVFLVTSRWPITARCLPYLWCHMDINTLKSLKEMFVKQAAFVERLPTSVRAHYSFSSKANVLHWFVARLASLLACKLFFLCLCLLVSVVLQWAVSPAET